MFLEGGGSGPVEQAVCFYSLFLISSKFDDVRDKVAFVIKEVGEHG